MLGEGRDDQSLKLAAGCVLAAWFVLAVLDLADYLASLERRLANIERPNVVRGPWKERDHDRSEPQA
jgi:hypothetical protein